MTEPIALRLLRTAFGEHTRRWKAACLYLSSSDAIASHPSYKAIISMGPAAIPLILAELQKEPSQWFHALRAITGEDPVPAEDRGHVARMAAAWIGWGRQRGHL